MVPDPRKALVERLLDRLYPVTPNGRTGFAWKEYDATKAELLALLATDPTTLRTALGLSVFTLAGFAQHRPWCPEADGPADCTCGLYGLLDAIQCVCGHKVSVHTTRQVGDAVGWPCGGCKSDRCTGFAIAIEPALATPAPAADPTTLRTALEAWLYEHAGNGHTINAYADIREAALGTIRRVAYLRCANDQSTHNLLTPAPAADEARCGCGLESSHPFHVPGHSTFLHRPAPTPAPPTPPATEEGPAVVVAHWGGDPDSCSLHGDIPRDVSPAEHVRELHAAEIDAWERVSIDGHPGWAEPTPPATEPVAALVSELVGDLRLSELGRDGRLDIVARKLDAIVAAARAEVDVEALAEALDGLPYRDCEMWVNNDIPTAGFAHDLADAYLAARARRAGESRA